MSEKGQTEILRELCMDHIGDHYESEPWRSIARGDDYDWADHYPIIDGSGCLTGEVLNSSDDDDYANVDDRAVVDIADLDKSQRAEIRREQADGSFNGYAAVPGPTHAGQMSTCIPPQVQP